jgi:flagellar assembly protein FliH
MQVVRKFLFDNAFDAESKGVASVGASAGAKPERVPAAVGPKRANPSFSEAELQSAAEAARQKGEEAGIAKGRAEANSQQEKQIVSAIAGVSSALGALAKAQGRIAEGAGHAIELSLAIARKLHPALAERGGLTEIEAILAECLETLKREKRLVVYVAPALLDAMMERLDRMTSAAGFEGRVVLIGDEAMTGSDCRVEWADGGVERDAMQTWREIEAALDRYLSADVSAETPTGDNHGG